MDETDVLRAELDHYKSQKQKIRDIVGQIGGKSGRRRHAMINGVFLLLVLGAFVFEAMRHIMGWKMTYLPPALALEVAVLLVSLKIIWMIHTQGTVAHFQFWVLNSIEFQMNMLSRRIAELSKALPTMTKLSGEQDTDG